MSTTSKPDLLVPIEAIRVIACLLVTLFHASISSTFPFKIGSVNHVNFVNNPTFTFMYGGVGFTDIFFVISGYLLTVQLVGQSYSLWRILVSKAIRLVPAMLILTVYQMFTQWPDAWLVPYYLTFTSNLFRHAADCYPYLPAWSNAVVMQGTLILGLILLALKKINMLNTKVMILLFFGCIAYRIALFEPMERNVFMLKNLPHTGKLLPPTLVPYLADTFNFTWPATEDPVAHSIYHLKWTFGKLYVETPARFGGFVLGAILGLEMMKLKGKTVQSTYFKSFIGIVFQLMGLLLFVIPLLPSRETDIEGQKIVTGVAPYIASIGVTMLLYCVLVPSDHPFHARALYWILSRPFWMTLASLAYGVYVYNLISFVHIWMGVFKVRHEGLPDAHLPTHQDVFMIYIANVVLCSVLAKITLETIEKPAFEIMRKIFLPTPAKKVEKKE